MKSVFNHLNLILGAALLLLLGIFALPGLRVQAATPTPAAETAPQADCDSGRSVQVSGTALVNVTPDRALIQLGVQSNGATPDAVQAANTSATQKVFAALTAQGIDAKDISTDIYIIDPVYENYDSLYIKGYRINNVVAVTVRDVQKTSGIIAAALKAGANQVVEVEFYTSQLRQYRDQARDLAIKAAQEKAAALASAAGAQTGCVLSISEVTSSNYNGWWSGRYNQNQNLWMQNSIQNAPSSSSTASGSGDEPISLGQISVKAEVSASYSLK